MVPGEYEYILKIFLFIMSLLWQTIWKCLQW